MTSWDESFPPDFPIDEISRRAFADGTARRQRRRTRHRLAATVLAVVVVGAGLVATTTRDRGDSVLTAGPTPLPSVPVRARNGKIAFVRSTGPGDRAPKLYVMNGDGSDQRLVRELPSIQSLDWSPDGSKLVFNDEQQIVVVNGDGTGLRQLATGGGGARWSPDGSRIAYSRRNAGNSPGSSIWVMNADGSAPSQLVAGEYAANPTWSPDGASIAYTDGIGDGQEVYIASAAGSGEKRVLRIDGYKEQPAWSPDGTRIAFRRFADISVVNVDGSAQKALSSPPTTGLATPPDGGYAFMPRWSPDGSKIAYTLLNTGEICSIWTVNADGRGQTRLTDGTHCDRDAAWQPIPRT